MAEVFLARRRASGGVEKRMVIKRIRRERARDARFAAMFVREARLSMSLAHKNIVPVFDFGRAGDELFLVMEYVDGVDLSTALARAAEIGVPPAPVLVAFIGLEACQALEYAHRASGHEGEPRGVIHRDVTPANVLLSYSGEVKLLDFGIATSESALGEMSKVRGTPPYMAPEQARGEALSPRTDVFALGLVLWEALSLRRAYAAKDAREALATASRGEVPALDPDRAPAPLRAIIECATRPDPAERYADAGAMQTALDEFLIEARAGVERRGPVHQMLAAWLREVAPEQEPAMPSGEVRVPDGPVATFLDDGEERVTMLFPPPAGGSSTARSMAATVTEPGEDGDAGLAAPASATPRRSRAWMAIAAAAALLVGVPAAVLVARKLTPRDAQPARAEEVAADSAAGERTDAAPPADVPAPRPESRAAVEVSPGPADVAGHAARPAAEAEQHPREGGRPAARRAGAAGAGARAEGAVRVSSSPWAEVRVIGRADRCRETPCTLRLPAGTYTLALRNPVAHVGKNVVVEVRPHETITLRETLTAPR